VKEREVREREEMEWWMAGESKANFPIRLLIVTASLY